MDDGCPRHGGKPLIQQASETLIRVRTDTYCDRCNDAVAKLWGFMCDNDLFKPSLIVPPLPDDWVDDTDDDAPEAQPEPARKRSPHPLRKRSF